MKKVTKLFSGETYVTLSGVLPAIRYIEGVLNEKEEDIQEIVEVKCVTAEKISHYYGDLDIHNCLLLSSFLDRRYKSLSFLPDAAAKQGS